MNTTPNHDALRVTEPTGANGQDAKAADMDRAGELPIERRVANRRQDHPALVTLLAERVADLETALRSMWGYAIELDHDGEYFNRVDDEDVDRREEWRSSINKARDLINNK